MYTIFVESPVKKKVLYSYTDEHNSAFKSALNKLQTNKPTI